MAIDIDTSDIGDALNKELAQLDMMRFYEQVGELIVLSIDDNFQQGGRFGVNIAGEWTGGRRKWRPSWRAKEDKGQTLIDTGRLVSSITYVASPQGVQVGTNVSYGRKHHYGLEGNQARPFLVVQDEDIEEINDLFLRFLSKQLGSR